MGWIYYEKIPGPAAAASVEVAPEVAEGALDWARAPETTVRRTMNDASFILDLEHCGKSQVLLYAASWERACTPGVGKWSSLSKIHAYSFRYRQYLIEANSFAKRCLWC